MLTAWKSSAFSLPRHLRRDRKAADKSLSDEKYTGKVLLQKTVSDGVAQIKNGGLVERYENVLIVQRENLQLHITSDKINENIGSHLYVKSNSDPLRHKDTSPNLQNPQAGLVYRGMQILLATAIGVWMAS